MVLIQELTVHAWPLESIRINSERIVVKFCLDENWCFRQDRPRVHCIYARSFVACEPPLLRVTAQMPNVVV
jgi:hypothetical protein